MRRIGGHVSSGGGPLNAIKNTQAIGANCLQIFAGSPRGWARSLYDAKVAENFVKQVAELDLNPVFIHALYLTNLASDNPELVEKSKTAIIMDLNNSSLLRAAGVILHIGSHLGRGFDAVKDLVAAGISEVLDKTPHDSYLLLENAAGQQGKIGSLTELSYLLNQVKSERLRVCLDTAHAFSEGYDLRNTKGLDAYIEEIKSTISLEKVALIHLNDSKIDLGKRNDQHENLGEGYIGAAGLKLVINSPLLSHLPLIMEVPGFDGNGPDAKNVQIAQGLVD
jgi:deoxyribonuclease IV